MQTHDYQKYTQRAARAERDQDYPMAAVFWGKAKESACTMRQKHWAECRCEHCAIMGADWDV